jgi:RNA-binding protein
LKLRELKAQGQLLPPVVHVGKLGLTPAVLAETDRALSSRELIKIRFEHDRDERAQLAEQIVAATGARLVQQVGKVAVFYRPKPPAATAPQSPDRKT